MNENPQVFCAKADAELKPTYSVVYDFTVQAQIPLQTAESIRNIPAESDVPFEEFAAHCDALCRILNNSKNRGLLRLQENLNAEHFVESDIADWEGFKTKLRQHKDPVSESIWKSLDEKTRLILMASPCNSTTLKERPPSERKREAMLAICSRLNAMIDGGEGLSLFSRAARMRDIQLREETVALAEKPPATPKEERLLSRQVLEDAFGYQIVRMDERRPVLQDLYLGLLRNVSLLTFHLDPGKPPSDSPRKKRSNQSSKKVATEAESKNIASTLREIAEAGIMAGLRFGALRAYTEWPKRRKRGSPHVWDLAQSVEDSYPRLSRSKKIAKVEAIWQSDWKQHNPGKSGPVPNLPLNAHYLMKNWSKKVRINPQSHSKKWKRHSAAKAAIGGSGSHGAQS